MAAFTQGPYFEKMSTVVSVSLDGVNLKDPKEVAKIDAKVIKKVSEIIEKLKASHSKFEDPDFGPTEEDDLGAKSFYGTAMPAPAGSKYPKPEDLRWDRPQYEDTHSLQAGGEEEEKKEGEEGGEDEDGGGDGDDDDEGGVWCKHGSLFLDGASSNDVIQGQLGDCWFLGALAVMGANATLLEDCFWHRDEFAQYGFYVLRFFKDCMLMFVIIDDRIPVKKKDGKPIFASSKDPNVLWVPLIEKAYAKLHGCFKALIGGYSHYALSDMTGYCPRLVVLKPGFTGFSEAMDKEEVWALLCRYKEWGCLMGTSIQSNPKENHKVEAEAGMGLHMGHAYSFLDLGEIDEPITKTKLRLVKLRNPWGKGEWEGPYGDRSDERDEDTEEGKKVNEVVNAVFEQGLQKTEKIEVDFNDGTFFMPFDAWLERFTSLFVAVNFPHSWVGKRTQGSWSGETGGNRDMGSWMSNPKVKFHLRGNKGEWKQVFVGLYIRDSRLTMGFDYFKDPLYATPLAFDIVTEDEFEKPDARKTNGGYVVATGYKKKPAPGTRPDAMKQPPYNFGTTQIEVFLEAGRDYFIVPSLYKRAASGTYFLTVYAECDFELDGAAKISSDQELMTVGAGDKSSLEESKDGGGAAAAGGGGGAGAEAAAAPGGGDRPMSKVQYFEKKEQLRERLNNEARKLGISVQSIKTLFAGDIDPSDPSGKTEKRLLYPEFKRRLLQIGFSLADLPDGDLIVLDSANVGTVSPAEFIDFFALGLEFTDSLPPPPPPPVDDLAFKAADLEGVLSVVIKEGRQLRGAATWFSNSKPDPVEDAETAVAAGGGGGGASADSTPAPNGPKPRRIIKYEAAQAAGAMERAIKAAAALDAEESLERQKRYPLRSQAVVAPAPATVDATAAVAGSTDPAAATAAAAAAAAAAVAAAAAAPAAAAATGGEKLVIDVPLAVGTQGAQPTPAGGAATLASLDLMASPMGGGGGGGPSSYDDRNDAKTHKSIGGMSATGYAAAEKAGQEAAHKLHTDQMLMYAEVNRTKNLTILRREMQKDSADKASKDVEEAGALRMRGKTVAKREKRNILDDATAMALLSYNPIKKFHNAEESTEMRKKRDKQPTSTDLSRAPPTSSALAAVAAPPPDASSAATVPAATEPVAVVASVSAGKTETSAKAVANIGQKDLWDFLVDRVVTIVESRAKGRSSELTKALMTIKRNFRPSRDMFTKFDPPRSAIPSPKVGAKPSKPVKGSIPTPKNMKKRSGTASVTTGQTAAQQKATISDAFDKLRGDVEGSYDEVYRRLVNIPILSASEIDGDRGGAASGDVEKSTTSNLAAFAKRLFRQFDKNLNGLISLDEFHQALLDMNIDVTADDAQTMFNRFETGTKDGNIDWNEFLNFFNSRIAHDMSFNEAAVATTAGVMPIQDLLIALHKELSAVAEDMRAHKSLSVEDYLKRKHTLATARTPDEGNKAIEALKKSYSTTELNTPYALPDNAIFHHLTSAHTATNAALLNHLGLPFINEGEMKRINRLFEKDVKKIMAFVTNPKMDMEHAIRMTHSEVVKIFKNRAGAGKSGPGKSKEITAANLSKLWSLLSPTNGPVHFEDMSAYLLEMLTDAILSDPTNAAQAQEAAATAAATGLDGTMLAPGSANAASSIEINFHGLPLSLLSRIVVDDIAVSSWNRSSTRDEATAEVGHQEGHSSTTAVTNRQVVHFSAFESYVRQGHINSIERKLKYLLQLELSLSGPSMWALVHVYISHKQDEAIVLMHEPLSGDVYKTTIKEDLSSLPVYDKLRELFVRKEAILAEASKAIDKCILNDQSFYLYNPFETPLEDAAISDMVSRLRLVKGSSASASASSESNKLIIAEDPRLVNQLKSLLEAASTLPFFSICNDTNLFFEVDREVLEQEGSIKRLVFGSIRKQKNLHSFLVSVVAELKVVLSSYNSGVKVNMPWSEMLAHLTEYRNPFVTVQLKPKFLEPWEYVYRPTDNKAAFTGEEEVDLLAAQRGNVIMDGSTHPTFNSKFKISFRPPKLTSCKLMSTEITELEVEGSVKVVILMVREAKRMPKNEKDRIRPGDETFKFLTIYDPRSATDYQCGVKRGCELYDDLLEPLSAAAASTPLDADEEKALRKAFEDLDTDENNFLDKKEIKKYFKNEHGPGYTYKDKEIGEEQFNRELEEASPDNCFSFREFVRFVKAYDTMQDATRFVKTFDTVQEATQEIKIFMEHVEDACKQKMIIVGPAITPHLEIVVHNAKGRQEEVLGSCQMSISSVLSGSGVSKDQAVTLLYAQDQGNGKEISVKAGEVTVELGFRKQAEIDAEEQAKKDREERIKNGGSKAGSRAGSRRPSVAAPAAPVPPSVPKAAAAAAGGGGGGGGGDAAAIAAATAAATAAAAAATAEAERLRKQASEAQAKAEANQKTIAELQSALAKQAEEKKAALAQLEEARRASASSGNGSAKASASAVSAAPSPEMLRELEELRQFKKKAAADEQAKAKQLADLQNAVSKHADEKKSLEAKVAAEAKKGQQAVAAATAAAASKHQAPSAPAAGAKAASGAKTGAKGGGGDLQLSGNATGEVRASKDRSHGGGGAAAAKRPTSAAPTASGGGGAAAAAAALASRSQANSPSRGGGASNAWVDWANVELPHGWDKKVDANSGKVYYIDHINRVTQWKHPLYVSSRSGTGVSAQGASTGGEGGDNTGGEAEEEAPAEEEEVEEA